MATNDKVCLREHLCLCEGMSNQHRAGWNEYDTSLAIEYVPFLSFSTEPLLSLLDILQIWAIHLTPPVSQKQSVPKKVTFGRLSHQLSNPP